MEGDIISMQPVTCQLLCAFDMRVKRLLFYLSAGGSVTCCRVQISRHKDARKGSHDSNTALRHPRARKEPRRPNGLEVCCVLRVRARTNTHARGRARARTHTHTCACCWKLHIVSLQGSCAYARSFRETEILECLLERLMSARLHACLLVQESRS